MCQCSQQKSDLSLLAPVLEKYAAVPGSLITILQKAQDIYGYLPTDVLYAVAEATGDSPAKVLGVATFYTQFRLQPVGKYLIMQCQGTACHVNGSERISKAITEELGIRDGETTADGLFTLKDVACLGCCSLSPVMMINGETYGTLTPEKTVKILRSLKEQAGKEAQG
ncbi:MAG: NADH-quinone oxidoreductase subunit NuoE [Lachnospiraceae bacterium]|nr:NADH-quinone oxidoreductase subunit NuoE [Lachnospiraceae bacterium]